MREEDEDIIQQRSNITYLASNRFNNDPLSCNSYCFQRNLAVHSNQTRRHKNDNLRAFQDFTHLRVGGDFSDAIIHVHSVSFPVHRNILACCSPYFRALFTDLDRAYKTDNCDQSRCPAPPSCFEAGSHAIPHKSNHGIDSFHKVTTPVDDIDDREVKRWIGEADNIEDDSTQNHPLLENPRTDQASTENIMNVCRINDFGYTTNRLTSLASSRCYQVSIDGISPEVMNSIIEHAYGGKSIISSNNIQQLLEAADRFQVASLLRECCDFLMRETTIANCISIVKFSSNFFTCDHLRQKTTQFLLENFLSVFTESPEFEKLTCKELASILSADRLNVKHEEIVLDAIIRWVTADIPNRQAEILHLVQCVRVGLMHPDNMRPMVDRWLHSNNLDSMIKDVTVEVMESVLLCQKEQLNTVNGTMFSPRLPRDVLFVIGGSNFGFPLNLVEAYDCRTWTWSVICPYEFAPRSYHGVVSLDKEIYIIGGFSGHVYLSSCCKLNVGTLTWEDVTPMNTKRCYIGVAVIKNNIYAVGGFDGVYRLNSAERFTTRTNQWSFISPMMQQRSDAGVAVLNDLLYVCGGFNGTDCIRAAEMYDPQTDVWTSIPGMPRARSGLGLVAHSGWLYAVGGFDGIDSSVRLSTTESYNPVTRQWSRLDNMPHPRSNLAVEVLEDVLYAIGGYSGDRTTSVVDCYDFSTSSWYETANLSHNRSALGACVISGLPNTAELLGRFRDSSTPTGSGKVTMKKTKAGQH